MHILTFEDYKKWRGSGQGQVGRWQPDRRALIRTPLCHTRWNGRVFPVLHLSDTAEGPFTLLPTFMFLAALAATSENANQSRHFTIHMYLFISKRTRLGKKECLCVCICMDACACAGICRPVCACLGMCAFMRARVRVCNSLSLYLYVGVCACVRVCTSTWGWQRKG